MATWNQACLKRKGLFIVLTNVGIQTNKRVSLGLSKVPKLEVSEIDCREEN